MEHQESGHPKTYTVVVGSCRALAPMPWICGQVPRHQTSRPRYLHQNPLTRPQAQPEPALGLADVSSPGFPRRAPEWQAWPSISTGHSSPTWQHLHSSHDGPQLASFPFPSSPPSRQKDKSTVSVFPPSPFFPECLFEIPFFSSCLSPPPSHPEAPTSRAARANSPIPILVLSSVSVSDSPSEPPFRLRSPPSAPPSLAPSLSRPP